MPDNSVQCPVCDKTFSLIAEADLQVCPDCHVRFALPGAGLPAPEAWVQLEAGTLDDDPSAESPAFLLPPALLNRFRIERRIGGGSFAIVYQAVDLSTKQNVAIKFLKAVTDHNVLVRFLREGILLRQITHPNLIEIYEAGQVGRHPYLILEYLARGSLREQITQVGAHEPEQAVNLGVGLLGALHALHSQAIIHRDIKPENILLNHRGQPKLADLGIAKDYKAGAPQLTALGELIGTPRYMAPELLELGAATISSDLFSVGLVLYELLCGHHPFEDKTAYGLLQRYVKEPIKPLNEFMPDISKQLSRCVMRGLSIKEGGRPASAEEWAEQLLHVVGSPRSGKSSGSFNVSSTAIKSDKTSSGSIKPDKALVEGRSVRSSGAMRPDKSTAKVDRAEKTTVKLDRTAPSFRSGVSAENPRPAFPIEIPPEYRKPALIAAAILVVLLLAVLAGLRHSPERRQDQGSNTTSETSRRENR
jgi:serine/threonine protein kinase